MPLAVYFADVILLLMPHAAIAATLRRYATARLALLMPSPLI